MLLQHELHNLLLARVPPNAFALVAKHLEPVDCPQGRVLVDHDEPIDFAYFLETGVASIIARSPEGLLVESGLIGREGFVHPASALGAKTIPHQVVMQIGGHGFRMKRSALLDIIDESRALRIRLLCFVQILMVQTSYTALSNGVHQVDERLARWLLMCHDRIDSDEIHLTHDFLAIMLAVRRPTVTNALHVLEGNGYIFSERRYITIKNRAALEAFACDAYGKPEKEYAALLGPMH